MNSAINSKGAGGPRSAGGIRYSIVIVTYNSKENIRVCLDSLRRCGTLSEHAHEYIVVDNNSRDGTPEFLSSQSDVRAILNKENNGFSKGCNQGAAIAKGEYLIFLNPDTMVTPGWSDAMARYFQDTSVGAVGPVSNYVAGLQRLDMNLPSEWQNVANFPGKSLEEIANKIAEILKKANGGKGVTTRLLIGFCLMMGRAFFESIGGMDEKLFLGNDDLDLSWRLRNLGLKLVVATDAFVLHEGQKSFKTEAKTHVDKLVQESTDALYLKLVDHYGGRDKVPAPTELWGIPWFTPSPALMKEPQQKTENMEADVKNGSQARKTSSSHKISEDLGRSGGTVTPEIPSAGPSAQIAWSGITAVIYLGSDAAENSAEKRGPNALPPSLERTLATLPARPGCDILVLNCSDSIFAIEAPEGATLRKLDLGSGCSPKQALETGLAMISANHGFFCIAGVESSAMFNHWLEKRDRKIIRPALSIPLRIEGMDEGLGSEVNASTSAAYAFLFRKDWLKEILEGMPSPMNSSVAFFTLLGNQLRVNASASAGKQSDPPWLSARLSAQRPAQESWTPADDPINHYPESLRPAMREASEFGFAGAAAEMPPIDGAFKVYDLKGDMVPLIKQDLVILRVTPDMIEKLPERLINLRRQARKLNRLMVVVNGNQALRNPPRGFLAPIDLTGQGIRAALMESGYAVTSENPYRGFPETEGKNVANLEGWIQLDSFPRAAGHHHLDKMVSIVILGFNQVEYTKKCIDSIRKYTKQKYELILVDNGSKDGTENYFRSVPGAKVIRNAENLGVAKGWNQGLRIAEGDYLMVLNNDTIVGPDWLENMVDLAEADQSIGLVGPRSNYIAGPQLVPSVPYKTEGEIQGFIGKWQEDHARSASEFGFIKGFCHLIPRRVFAKVGPYDERYGKGNFEDDDYCMRVRCHGFRAYMANDSFIHHFGSVSFNQEAVDWKALMIENEKKYKEKWSKGPSAMHDTFIATPAANAASTVASPAAPASSAPSIASTAKTGIILPTNSDSDALAAIASRLGIIAVTPASKAPAAPAPATASMPASAAPLSAAPIAAASKPGARELAAGHEAYARGDVSSARTHFLDAQAKDSSNAEIYCCLGVIMFHEGKLKDATSLFIRGLEINPTHEDAARNLIDVLTEGNGKVTEADIAYLIKRYPSSAVFREMGATWTPVADAKISSSPKTAANNSDTSWKNEVESLIESKQYPKAINMLETRLKKGEDVGECYNFIGVIGHSCGDHLFALENFRRAIQHSPKDPDVIFNLSDTLLAIGRPGEAAALLEDKAEADEGALEQADYGATAQQIRHEITSSQPNFLRLLASREMNQSGEALLRQSKADEARPIFEAALKADPSDFRAMDNLGLTAFYQGDIDEAWAWFVKCLAVRPAWTDALINAFDTALALGRIKDMHPLLDRAEKASQGNREVTAMRGHIKREGHAIHFCKSYEEVKAGAKTLEKADKLMAEGKQSEAILIFLDAIKERAQNPQAYNGLGILAFSEKRYADAFGLFEHAATLHPTDEDILMNLWQCAQALKREGDVLPKLRRSLEKDPALMDVKAIVKEFA